MILGKRLVRKICLEGYIYPKLFSHSNLKHATLGEFGYWYKNQ